MLVAASKTFRPIIFSIANDENSGKSLEIPCTVPASVRWIGNELTLVSDSNHGKTIESWKYDEREWSKCVEEDRKYERSWWGKEQICAVEAKCVFERLKRKRCKPSSVTRLPHKRIEWPSMD